MFLSAAWLSAQRPDLVPGITSIRGTERGSGAPIRESLVSYSESTIATGGIGGLNAVFTAPTRRFEVEYPSGLKRGAIFDVGFDGRQAFRDRVYGNYPLGSSPLPPLDPTAATGGVARWPANAAPGVAYASPHAVPGSAPPPLAEATVETWVRPVSLSGEHTIIDAGAYRLFIARDTTDMAFDLTYPALHPRSQLLH